MTRNLFLALMVGLLVTHGGSAQDSSSARKIGLTAALQTNQYDMMIPIWVTPRTVFAPALGVVYVQDAGTDVSLVASFRHYGRVEKIAPYFVERAGALFNIPSEGSTVVDFVLGIGLGADYFVGDHFSFGVEAQLNATQSSKKSLRFGNPGGWNVNTASAVLATVYF